MNTIDFLKKYCLDTDGNDPTKDRYTLHVFGKNGRLIGKVPLSHNDVSSVEIRRIADGIAKKSGKEWTNAKAFNERLKRFFGTYSRAEKGGYMAELSRKNMDSADVNDAGYVKSLVNRMKKSTDALNKLKNERKFKNVKTGAIVSESEANRVSEMQKKMMNSWKMPWTREQLAKMADFAVFVPVDLLKNDSVESENDAYNLGMDVPNGGKNNDPVKIVSVTVKKEPDGASGTVKFTKGKNSFTENFMCYTSGNWDMKPINNPGMKYSVADRVTLMEAARKKLASLGIKAR